MDGRAQFYVFKKKLYYLNHNLSFYFTFVRLLYFCILFLHLSWFFLKNTAKRNTHSRVAMHLKYNKNVYIFQGTPLPSLLLLAKVPMSSLLCAQFYFLFLSVCSCLLMWSVIKSSHQVRFFIDIFSYQVGLLF